MSEIFSQPLYIREYLCAGVLDKRPLDEYEAPGLTLYIIPFQNSVFQRNLGGERSHCKKETSYLDAFRIFFNFYPTCGDSICPGIESHVSSTHGRQQYLEQDVERKSSSHFCHPRAEPSFPACKHVTIFFFLQKTIWIGANPT